MRFNIAAALLALLISSAFAGRYTAMFFPQPEPFSSLNESAPGHFGDYALLAGKKAPFYYISIEGEGASREKLSAEIALLKDNGLLRSDCAPSQIIGSDGDDFLCTEHEWKQCPNNSACSLSGETPVAQMAIAGTQGGETPQPQAMGMGTANAPAQDTIGITPASSRAFMKTGGEENAAGATAGESTGTAAQSGISLGQVLQLVGALIAVIVASYLVLQQRQVQVEVNPQEEKLLDNETRAGIMAELSNADKIPTDLSAKLGKSKATVVEHLSTLASAGFVERVSTPGRKYVFYRLTQKGKRALLRRAG